MPRPTSNQTHAWNTCLCCHAAQTFFRQLQLVFCPSHSQPSELSLAAIHISQSPSPPLGVSCTVPGAQQCRGGHPYGTQEATRRWAMRSVETELYDHDTPNHTDIPGLSSDSCQTKQDAALIRIVLPRLFELLRCFFVSCACNWMSPSSAPTKEASTPAGARDGTDSDTVSNQFDKGNGLDSSHAMHQGIHHGMYSESLQN